MSNLVLKTHLHNLLRCEMDVDACSGSESELALIHKHLQLTIYNMRALLRSREPGFDQNKLIQDVPEYD